MLHRSVAALALAPALAFPAAAQTARQAPDSAAAIELSFALVVRKSAPAVVNLYARQVVRTVASPLFQDPLFHKKGTAEDLVKQVMPELEAALTP